MSRRTLYVDVDETLLLHDMASYPSITSKPIKISCQGRSCVGFAHAAHVELIKKFWGLGYDIYIWSKTGKEWAEAVARKLGLRKYVTSYLTKPDYYMDDHPAEQWMLQRVYIDPETGKQK